MNWAKMGVIFQTARQHPWMASHAQIPVVVPHGDDALRVFLSVRDDQGRASPTYIDVAAADPRQVRYVHDQPLLPLGATGTFDDSGIMPFCAVPDGDRLKLYYVGWTRGGTVPYHQAIGLAVSEDGGSTFRKHATGPVFDRSVLEPYFVTAPWVLREGDRWRMWYVSCTSWTEQDGRLEPAYHIRYAESADGYGWQPSGRVCVDYDDCSDALARPYVYRDGHGYHMIFSYRRLRAFRTDRANSYHLGYAHSQDGLSWQRRDSDLGLSLSDTGWDSEMMAYAQGIEHHGERFLFYNGNGFGRSGVGYARTAAAGNAP
ncbi:MAG: hypothetical protein H7338_16840 [Candidatus Sericytochromatia bacterium]|nr:hypothetical protein [Candidatus Sericytochromatia bacterium]